MNFPEHHLSTSQISALLRILEPRPSQLNPAVINEELTNAGRYFTSALYFQNYPTAAVVIDKLAGIEWKANELLTVLKDPITTPYLRYTLGDKLTADNKLDSLIASVKELKMLAGQAANRDDLQQEKRNTPKGKRRHSAMFVLVQNLARIWLLARGEMPTISVQDAKASGKFVSFVQSYLAAMLEITTDNHRAIASTIAEELGISTDAIKGHFTKISPKLKASMRGRSTKVKSKSN